MPQPWPCVPEAPQLEAYSRCTVIELVPIIAHRLTRLIEDGDRRDAAARERREWERSLVEEGKRVRFEDRERKRRASIKMLLEAEDEASSHAESATAAPGTKWGTQPDDTKFHARDRPGMTVEAYLMRIAAYTPIQLDALLLGLVYLNRLSRLQPPQDDPSPSSSPALFPTLRLPCVPQPGTEGPSEEPATVVPINSRTIHRLLLSFLLISAKFSSDAFIPHARAAKVGGVSEKELQSLEVEAFKLMGWTLCWRLEEVEGVARNLLQGDDDQIDADIAEAVADDTKMEDGAHAAPVSFARHDTPSTVSSESYESEPPQQPFGSSSPQTSSDSSLDTSISSSSSIATSKGPSVGPSASSSSRVVFATPSPTPTPPSSSAPSTPSNSPPGSPYSAKSGRSSRSNRSSNSRGSRSKSTTPRLIVAAQVEGLAEELREGMMLDDMVDYEDEYDPGTYQGSSASDSEAADGTVRGLRLFRSRTPRAGSRKRQDPEEGEEEGERYEEMSSDADVESPDREPDGRPETKRQVSFGRPSLMDVW